MMFYNKKGDISVESMIKILLGIIILVILAGAAYLYIVRPLALTTSCKDQGGQCIDSLAGCAEGSQHVYHLKCEGSQKCCLPDQLAVDETARFSTAQRQAIANPIFLTIGKDPAPVTSLNLKEGDSFDLSIKFNDKLPDESFGPVAIYVSNSKNPGVIYGLGTAGIAQQGSIEELPFFEGGKKLNYAIKYKPTLFDTYQQYTLRVVVLDQMKVTCRDVVSDQKKWADCLAGKIAPTADMPSTEKEKTALVSDKTYWLAGKSYSIKTQRILDVTGVSTQWVAEDTISIIANDPKYSKQVEIGLVNAYDKTFDEVINLCVAGTSVKSTPKITNIVGTTLETSGIPLNINIGGFRLPTGKTELKYITSEKPIAMANGRADIKIDKATMIKDFYKLYQAQENSEQLIAGQNTFICAKATADGTNWVHAVSESPLKVDVLPPFVDKDSIRIIYPEATINTPLLQQEYPSMIGQNYFYQQYPRVVISCQDYGQSGCANYDYYLKTDNFVNIQVQSTDPKDAILGVGLQVGLNKLFEYLVARDPLNTFCPPAYSTAEYRRNTQNVIPLRVKGQGMICVRVSDKAGNAAVVWSEIWNPQELIDKVAAEVQDEVLGGQ